MAKAPKPNIPDNLSHLRFFGLIDSRCRKWGPRPGRVLRKNMSFSGRMARPNSHATFLITPSSDAVGARRPVLWKRFSARGRGENQADRALEQEIIPRPISEDEQTVAESNQVDEVHAQPREPRRNARKRLPDKAKEETCDSCCDQSRELGNWRVLTRALFTSPQTPPRQLPPAGDCLSSFLLSIGFKIEGKTFRRVGDVHAIDAGPGCERVQAAALGTRDVLHLDTPRCEGIRNQ